MAKAMNPAIARHAINGLRDGSPSPSRRCRDLAIEVMEEIADGFMQCPESVGAHDEDGIYISYANAGASMYVTINERLQISVAIKMGREMIESSIYDDISDELLGDSYTNYICAMGYSE